MHRPPAVAWLLVLSRWQVWALSALVLIAALVWAGFLAKQGWGAASFLILVALLTSVLMVLVARQNTTKGRLSWDGEQWHWSGDPDSPLRSMSCVLDLQRVMLLQVTCGQGKLHWLWLEAVDKPAQWTALRRAIVVSTADSGEEFKPEQSGG
jgi:hypothetical protein